MIFLVRRASRKSMKETEKLIVAIADNGKKEEGRSGHTPRVCGEGMSLVLSLLQR